MTKKMKTMQGITAAKATEMLRKSEPFYFVTEMETPLRRAGDLARAVMLMLSDVDESIAMPIYTVAEEIERNILEAEEHRCQLFRITHPSRAHFEKVGWPVDQRTEAA